MAKILFLISIMLLSCYLTEQSKLPHDNTVEKKTKVTNTLKVGENVDPKLATEEYLMSLRTKRVEAATKSILMYKTHDPRYVSDDGIYKEFDARKYWPRCKTIGEVLNNGNTKVSWAYANAGVFADRMCIATNGSYNQLLSTEELISCSGLKLKRTYYGYISPLIIWEYFKNHGLVSGGKYKTNDGCQPSKIPPIGNIPTHLYTHACARHCYGNNTIDYNHDHVKASHYYAIPYENIQKELQAYGPVTAILDLHEDFFLYKSGVYEKTENSKFVRYQFAKLIGWGVENGVDYWLLVNSWGKEWGQNGLFKIRRDTNACGIEVYGGVPETK